MIVTLTAFTVYRRGAEKMMIIAREWYSKEHDEHVHDQSEGDTNEHATACEQQWLMEQ